MHFDLNDLRLFVFAANEGNLTRAAQRQHLSLAAASARIKSLEEQSGLPLLYRQARGVRLTPAGEAFFHHACCVLQQVDQLRADLHEYSGGLRGHVRVFANTTAVTDFLPELLPDFLNANPRVNVDLHEKPNADIARGVRDGVADIGIVAGQVDTLGLQSIHFSTDRLVLVTSRKHRFAQMQRIAFADILGKTLKLRIQLSSFDSMCRMIGAGVGVGIVPESAARRHLDSLGLALIELTDPWSVRERYILVRDLHKLPRYAQALIERLRAHYAQAV